MKRLECVPNNYLAISSEFLIWMSATNWSWRDCSNVSRAEFKIQRVCKLLIDSQWSSDFFVELSDELFCLQLWKLEFHSWFPISKRTAAVGAADAFLSVNLKRSIEFRMQKSAGKKKSFANFILYRFGLPTQRQRTELRRKSREHSRSKL